MTKISALSDIGTSVASNDTFVLVDVSDPTTPNKKIQQQNLFLIPDGSVGTPGLRFLNDTNVGLYRPTTDTLAFVSAGQNRLHITSAGLVGIGTSLPLEKLTIEGLGEQTLRLCNLTAGSNASPQSTFIKFFGYSSDGTPGGAEPRASIEAQDRRSNVIGGFLNISTANTSSVLTNALHIDSAQRVGIGTTSPGYALDVASSVAQVGNSTDAFIQYKSTAGNWHVGANSSNAYVFYSGTYASGTERARIDSSGRLLVGTSSASGVNSNTALVLAGNFASFTGSVSANHNTATTLFALENLNATYIVTAVITGTANAGAYHAVYIIGSVAANSHSIQALKAGSLLTLSLSGANVQATQGSGVAQTVTWSVTRMANL